MWKVLSVVAVAVSLVACGTVSRPVPPDTYESTFVPEKFPTAWYINRISLDHDGWMCRKQCLVITVSEAPPGIVSGAIVFYDLKQVPGLLQSMGVAQYGELVGKRVSLKNEQDSYLAPLVKSGRQCSEWSRRDPLIRGKYWC